VLQASGEIRRLRPLVSNGWLIAAVDIAAFAVIPLAFRCASRHLNDTFFELVSPTIVAVAIALTLIYVVEQPRSVAGKILNIRPLRWLGMTSYSLYLWQQLFLSEQFHLLPWGYLYLAIAFLLSYVLVERPSYRLRAYLERMRPTATGGGEAAALPGQAA
jgi:peptidoglycan/LPS O-acetylase OafA/YrhL